MSCPACNAEIHPADRRCSHCGAELKVERPARSEILWRNRRRIGAQAVALGLVISWGVNHFGGDGGSGSGPKSVPEQVDGPGYVFVRSLAATGAIHEFAAEEPPAGWDSEYALDGGTTIARFAGGRISLSGALAGRFSSVEFKDAASALAFAEQHRANGS